MNLILVSHSGINLDIVIEIPYSRGLCAFPPGVCLLLPHLSPVSGSPILGAEKEKISDSPSGQADQSQLPEQGLCPVIESC